VLIALGVGIGMTFLANRTRLGRYIYAIGGNPEAAELAGINTKRITVIVFSLMGMLAAISASISSARLDSATNALGQFDELYVIAAAVIGGTSLAGGAGGAIGSIFGALALRSIGDLLFVFDMDPLWQPLFQGLVLLLAVSLSALRLLQVRNRLELFR
jgi:D-xylose transport system permease protein